MKMCSKCFSRLSEFNLAYLKNLPQKYKNSGECLECLLKHPAFFELREFEKRRKQKKYFFYLLLYCLVLGGTVLLGYGIGCFFPNAPVLYILAFVFMPFSLIFCFVFIIKIIKTFEYSSYKWTKTEYVAEGSLHTTYDGKLGFKLKDIKEETHTYSNDLPILLRTLLLTFTFIYWAIPYWVYISVKYSRMCSWEPHKAYAKTRKQYPKLDPFEMKKK